MPAWRPARTRTPATPASAVTSTSATGCADRARPHDEPRSTSMTTPPPAVPPREAEPRPRRRFGTGTLVAVAALAALAAVGIAALLTNIFAHQQEARNPFYRVVEITDTTDDPAIWGKNFPLQYDGYRRTVDQTRTRYGGSEGVPHARTSSDP